MSTNAAVNGAIDEVFLKTKHEERAALIGYVVAGDPDIETTVAVIGSVVEAGIDILELGIPYGDPLADGPTIQAAAQRALDKGMTIETVFKLIQASKVPVILFTYANPVVQYGVDKFAAAAKRHGAAGVIIPDIPLEELDTVREQLHKNGLAMPLLVAPTTPDERAKRIAEATDGFVYLVSRLGVTGTKDGIDTGLVRPQIERLRALTNRPIAIGFGISRGPQVVAIRDVTDGIIIGSALIESYATQKGAAPAAAAAGAFIRRLRLAAKRAAPAPVESPAPAQQAVKQT